MKKVSFKKPLIVLLVIVALIKVLTFNRSIIEHYYSSEIYKVIGRVYRTLFGWIPFSLGDILYTAAGIYVIAKIVKLITRASRKELTKLEFKRYLEKTIIIAVSIYIIFNINWGLNYNRLGIGYQLKLSAKEHTKEDLLQLTDLLIGKVNEGSKHLGPNRRYPSNETLFADAQVAYKSSEKDFPFLSYRDESIKGSLYGKAGNYMGFLGYYNPFTGESQLNLTQPRFLLPFVICHEMAHQVGYANESEANFVGYLTALHSPDTLFHYSAYFDLFNYANNELASRDSTKARENYKRLDTLVRKDYVELRNFYRRYRNPFESVIKVFYDNYLKANQQSKGIQSYDQVVGLMISYIKKYGKI